MKLAVSISAYPGDVIILPADSALQTIQEWVGISDWESTVSSVSKTRNPRLIPVRIQALQNVIIIIYGRGNHSLFLS